GKLHPALTATDVVLSVTEMLRKAKVVGKFVEFYGEGTESLSVTDRATLANMAPEYGATMGFFPVDQKTVEYFRGTGRTDEQVSRFTEYFKAQGLFGIPKQGQIDYSQELELDLSSIKPSLAGPKRPQDRIDLDKVSATFQKLFTAPVKENGFGKKAEDLRRPYKTYDGAEIRNGDVLIAAITSCTNTSKPGRSRRRSTRRSRRTISSARRCYRATVTSRRASIRTSARISSHRRRSWWPTRSRAPC